MSDPRGDDPDASAPPRPATDAPGPEPGRPGAPARAETSSSRKPGGPFQQRLRRRAREIIRKVEETAAATDRARVWVPVHIARITGQVARQFVRDRCPQQAASLSFQTVLSIVPFCAVALAVLRASGAMDEGSALVEFIAHNVLPVSRELISESLISFSDKVTFESMGLIGLIVTVLIAFMLINTLENIINRIWRAERRRSVTQKFVVFYATATIGPFVLGMSVFQAARHGLTSGVSGVLMGFAVSFGGLLMVNYFLPGSPVRLKAAAIGAAVSTVLFEVAKHGFSLYVTGYAFERYAGVYGAIAVLPILLIWIYYSWLVLLFGVQVTYVMQNAHLIGRLDRRGALSLENELLQRVNGVVATRVMLAVCEAYIWGHKVLTRDAVGERFGLSDDVIDRITRRLKRADLVLEVEGDHAGFLPARPPAEIVVADVLRVFRGDDVAVGTGADARLDQLLAELEAEAAERTSHVSMADLVADEPPPGSDPLLRGPS